MPFLGRAVKKGRAERTLCPFFLGILCAWFILEPKPSDGFSGCVGFIGLPSLILNTLLGYKIESRAFFHVKFTH